MKLKKEKQTIKELMKETEIFKTILRYTQKELKKELSENILPVFYPKSKIKVGDGYIIVEGETPIMVLAHMDTVHKSIPSIIIHDKENRLMSSPQGIGGDDRSGIFGIIILLLKGHRPHLLFTEDEEIGGVGSTKASKALYKPQGLKYLIQLDRRGSRDAVFYSCDNSEFHSFVEEYDFTKASGSFTDISVLMPAWNICGVNLSIGYYNEHTKHEYINLRELESTITKVSKMLNTPPEKNYEFIEKTYSFRDRYSELLDDYYSPAEESLDVFLCEGCGEEVQIVAEKYGLYLCTDCLDLLNV